MLICEHPLPQLPTDSAATCLSRGRSSNRGKKGRDLIVIKVENKRSWPGHLMIYLRSQGSKSIYYVCLSVCLCPISGFYFLLSVWVLLWAILGIEPRASRMVGKNSTTTSLALHLGFKEFKTQEQDMLLPTPKWKMNFFFG